MNIRQWIILAFGIVSGPVWGQSCTTSMSLDECFDAQQAPALKSQVISTQLDAQARDVQKGLNNMVTSASTAGGQTAGTVLDLLPLVSITGLSSQDSGASQGNVLTFDYNFRLPTSLTAGKNAKLRIQLNRDPEMFAPLSQAILAQLPGADATVNSLKMQAQSQSDVVYTFTYSPANQKLGRSFAPHRAYYENMYRDVYEKVYADATMERRRKLPGEVTRKYSDCIKVNAFGNARPMSDWISGCKPEAQKEILKAFQSAFTAQSLLATKLEELKTTYQLKRYRQLLNNQPQLNVTFISHDRGDLVGPSQYGLKITYEHGIANLNQMEKSCSPGESQLDCFKRYIQGPGVADALDRGDRLSFSLDWQRVDQFDYQMASPGFTFVQPASDRLSASLGYGRMLKLGTADTDTARLDVAAEYQRFSNDPTRNSRAVATVTLTKKIGELTLPFTLVWANRPEFRGMVDKALSARLGIKYDLCSGACE